MQSEIAQKNEEARAKEQELTKQLNDNSTKLQEANNAISEKQTSLDRAIRAGSLRLKTTSCVQTSSSPTPPNGNSNQEEVNLTDRLLQLLRNHRPRGQKHRPTQRLYRQLQQSDGVCKW